MTSSSNDPRRDRRRRHLHRPRLLLDRPGDRRAGDRHGEVGHDAARLRAGRARTCCAKGGVSLGEIAFLAHGTTLVINALTERKGVKTGADHDRGLPRLAGDRARQPAGLLQPRTTRSRAPFVPRYLRREVPGRLAHDGARAQAARPRPACRRSSTTSAREGVEAVAICLLHSYAEPGARAGRARSACASSGRRSRSSRRTRSRREWREYERTSTAVLSAYVQPVAERYLDAARRAARATAASTASSTSCSRTAASTRSRRRRRSRSRWSSPGRRAASGARPSSAG